MCKDEKISIDNAAKELNMNRVTLMKRLDYADCEITNGFFSRDIYETILRQKDETVYLNLVLNDYYKEIKGKNTNEYFINKLIVYAAGYNFWGARYIVHPIFQLETYMEHAIYVYKDDVKTIKEHLREIIVLQGASYTEKFEFLINETCLKDYDETTGLLHTFFSNSNERSMSGIIEIGNYFRQVLKKELTMYDNSEMNVLLKNAETDLSGPGRNALVNFYAYIREHSSCRSNIMARYNRHGAESDKPVPPYDLNTYFSVAYMTLNSEYWNEQHMMQKAVEKGINAKVWLYHLMHYMCAWRSTDIRSKLPRFKLEDAPRVVLQKITSNGYSEQFYINVSEKIYYMVRYSGRKSKPNKTEKYDNAPLLKLTMAESIKPIFGMLALLCEAHNQIKGKAGSLCEMRRPGLAEGVRLFGTPYLDVLNGKDFSNRRANKNYMNMVSEKSEQMEVDGYMLAAYARSHTGGLGRVPEVTSRYLKAKMDGYSADEIVLCLMERGVCSFVPYLLCSAIDKEPFSKKRIKEQTADIKELYTSPAAIENILSIDEKLAQISKSKIKELIQWADSGNLKKLARQITECIIAGECYGKNEGVFCLAKACYKGCIQKQRTTCIGCGYEMYLKSIFIELSQEILTQEKMLIGAVTDGERAKRTMILEERLYPVSYEILSTIKYVFHEDITDYKKILERSGQYALACDV